MTPFERRALSRDLTRLANASVEEALAIDALPGDRCPLIGVTGPPGVGKSSLIAKLAIERMKDRASLAILAIDPSSPVSGGAILGDRIRMGELVDDHRIFIRSLATRGSLDGLADNLPLMLDRTVRAGFAEVIVETVGVGQVEYAVRGMVDTMLLVLSPGTGDQVQAMKSGIIEMPDIFVINKADQPGADRVIAELRSILNLRQASEAGWKPLILKVSAERVEGLSDLGAAIDTHQAWLPRSQPAHVAREWRRTILRSLLARRADTIIDRLPDMALDGALRASFAAALRDMTLPRDES